MSVKEYPKEKRALGSILDDKAGRLGDKIFIYYKDKTVTYGELSEITNRIANTFIHKLGVKAIMDQIVSSQLKSRL